MALPNEKGFLGATHTQALSAKFRTRGAYGDNGRVCRLLDRPGEPSPDIPETLFLLELGAEGKGGLGEGWLCIVLTSLSSCVFSAGSDCCAIDGGVTEPVEAFVPWLTTPSLEVSVECSVRKLALDRRRSSLRNAGAISRQWKMDLELQEVR